MVAMTRRLVRSAPLTAAAARRPKAPRNVKKRLKK
jgi:hypothetical protein